MRITPLDIQQKSFPFKFRGFYEEEVSAFLELIREEIEDLLRENASLKELLQKSDEESRRFWEIENLLNKSLLEANQMAEEYRAHGRKEAHLVLEKAEERAAEMMRHAREDARSIHEEIMALQTVRKRFRGEMRTTLNRFLKFVSGEEELNIEAHHFYRFPASPESLDEGQREERQEMNADTVPSRSEG